MVPCRLCYAAYRFAVWQGFLHRLLARPHRKGKALRRSHSLAALVCIVLAGPLAAADADVQVRSHQMTTSPPSARFELLQSTLAARWTFRLDRFTGRVWQLVRTADDDNTWEEMHVFERPQVQTPNRPRFQLFASGLAARHTFLLDSDTGRTWLVVAGKRKDKEGNDVEVTSWQPFSG